VECASGGDPLLLYKILPLLFFFLIWILCALCLESKKIINMVLMQDLWNSSFFSWGDVSPTHSELRRFVSGSKAKHRGSFPIIILLKNFCLHRLSQCLGKMWLYLPFAQCGTKHAHNVVFPKFAFRIRRTTVLEKFKDSAIILDVIQWSFLTKSATAAMFTSGRVDFGWPPLSSSSTRSLLSRNQEYHLKTFDQFRASFP
jgi:hypothetical protein